MSFVDILDLADVLPRPRPMFIQRQESPAYNLGYRVFSVLCFYSFFVPVYAQHTQTPSVRADSSYNIYLVPGREIRYTSSEVTNYDKRYSYCKY